MCTGCVYLEFYYACRFDPQTTQYQPYGKDWVKNQIYEQLKKQVGGAFSHSCVKV